MLQIAYTDHTGDMGWDDLIHSFIISRILNVLQSSRSMLTTRYQFQNCLNEGNGERKVRDWHQLLRI